MNLETKRLQLTEIIPDDLLIIHDIHSVAEVDEYNTLGIPKDIDVTKAVIQPD